VSILSLDRVKEKHRVTFDSSDKNQFVIHKSDGTTRCFKESCCGLYYLKTGASLIVVVNTVADNKTRYMNCNYSQVTLARKIQNIIGRPSTLSYLAIVENNQLPNCPINRQDILATEDIFGPNLGSLEGKTTPSTTKHMCATHVNIPINIMSCYRDVTITGNIMFVNTIPFFMTISRHIKFGTTEMTTSQTTVTLLAAIKQVRSACMKRGFRITRLMLDGQFKLLHGTAAALGITLNVVS
jgi:hypothetical protein